MDSSNLNALISAFRNETGKNSISPDTVGYLLQLIVNLSNENNVTLENSINALLTAIDNIGDEMNEHEESISELRTISDSQSLDINALKKKADIAETALASAQANEENISSLAEKNTEQDIQLENLEEQDSMFASSISELSKENQRQAQDISKIVADVNNIGVVNINKLANTTDYMTLETAISFLPEEMNCNGRIIVFKNSDSGTWDLYIKFIEGNDKSAWRVLYSESSLAEKNTEQDAAIVALNRLIESNTTLLVELEGRISNLRDEVGGNSNSITALASSIATINKDIYDVNEALLSLSQKISTLEGYHELIPEKDNTIT